MAIISTLLKEMEQEAQTTRKFLAIVPADKLGWKPHPKSMSLRELTGHIAELPAWVSLVLTTNELDFAATPYVAPAVNNAEELQALFEKSYEEGSSQLEKADEKVLDDRWVMRSGDQIYVDVSKAEMIRSCFSQTVHHRAQLGVFLRLLDIPIPGSYGPSADEQG